MCGSLGIHIYISDCSSSVQVSPEQRSPVRSGEWPARIKLFWAGVRVSRMVGFLKVTRSIPVFKKCLFCWIFFIRQIVETLQYVVGCCQDISLYGGGVVLRFPL